MIELIPAIDIIGGRCVRLTQGDYKQSKEYGDPVEMAIRFEQAGYRRLHMVDLDGARSKHVVNCEILRAVTKATSLCVDFGGGIKTEEDLNQVFEAGAYMATAGSVAVTNPHLYIQWLQKYGAEHLILGADVRNGYISINGWKEDSSMQLDTF
ncbi:MAG: HisA/HisF-related TIM barrel protein, partial [Bacteroidaceae bacterium]|nr:HisA/HisF-related TIM barrel protein [Bacteroidaceae bacterium]